MLSETGLVDKFKKIEALYLGATTLGEKAAALHALNNVQEKINYYKREELQEWSFKFDNHFEKKLFKALLGKYNLKPYRYKGQRYTTVMVQTSKEVVEKTLWPQYLEMVKALRSYLEDVTNDVIKKVMGQENSEDEIRDEQMKIELH